MGARGLVIEDQDRAKHYLNFIGYYRLKAYTVCFQEAGAGAECPAHTLRAGTTFERVLNLYIFDRELRLLLMDAIERIEVAVRSCISNRMCERHGAHWYLDSAHFVPQFRHAEFIRMVEKETGIDAQADEPRKSGMQPFLKHYFSKYTEPRLPPSWMICESLSFAKWSEIFKKLRDTELRKLISRPFGLKYDFLERWLHSLVYLRNLCAHHSLIWNRRFTIVPPAIPVAPGAFVDSKQLYIFAIMIHWLMKRIAPETTWPSRLERLFQTNSDAKLSEMGFPDGWRQKAFWST